MKILVSIALWTFVILGGALAFGHEVVELYGSVFVTGGYMAIVELLARIASTLLAVVISGAIAFVIMVIIEIATPSPKTGYEEREREARNKGLMTVLWFIVLTPALIFFHPFFMTSWVIPRYDWFVQFSYWEYFAVSAVMLILSLLAVYSSTNSK